MSFVTTQTVLASAVANAGTVTLAYPAGTTQATFIGANAAPNTGSAVLNDNEVFPEAASGVRIALTYNSGDITVTNNTGISWPAGSKLLVQLGAFGADRPGFAPAPAIAALTDSSGGTASTTLAAISGTYVQAEVRNSIATLAAQIERLRQTLRNAGITS